MENGKSSPSGNEGCHPPETRNLHERHHEITVRRAFAVRQRENGGKDIRAALFAGQAFAFRGLSVVTVTLRMDVLTIPAADTADHIRAAMLAVSMDIQTRHSQQIPHGKQRGRQGGRPGRNESFRSHFCKVSNKKAIFTIPINNDLR